MAASQQGPPLSEPPELAKYRRLVGLTTYVGGGLGALALFGDLAKDAFNESSAWLRAVFFTAVLLAAALLVRARQDAEWFLEQVRRGHKSTSDAEEKPFLYYKAATAVATGAGAVLLVAAWWAAAAPHR